MFVLKFPGAPCGFCVVSMSDTQPCKWRISESEAESLTDRKHLCVFPCRLFSHLTMFNPQHSHDINYSFHPQTACECVGDSVCVCVCTHSCLSFCVCMCVDSFEANSSFIPQCVSAAFTFCSAHFSFMLWFKNSSKFWVFESAEWINYPLKVWSMCQCVCLC